MPRSMWLWSTASQSLQAHVFTGAHSLYARSGTERKDAVTMTEALVFPCLSILTSTSLGLDPL